MNLSTTLSNSHNVLTQLMDTLVEKFCYQQKSMAQQIGCGNSKKTILLWTHGSGWLLFTVHQFYLRMNGGFS